MKKSMFLFVLFLSAILINYAQSKDKDKEAKGKEKYDIEIKFKRGLILKKNGIFCNLQFLY